MTAYWTDPESQIEYEVEFSVGSDVDWAGNLIPVIDNVDTMTTEHGHPVNFAHPPNMRWFKQHQASIFAACKEAIELNETDDYD